MYSQKRKKSTQMEVLNSLPNDMIDFEHEETDSQEFLSEKDKETCYRPISDNCLEDNKDLQYSSFSYAQGQFSNSNVNRQRKLHVFSKIEHCQPMDYINEMIFLEELKNGHLQSLDDFFKKSKTFSFPLFNNDNRIFTEHEKIKDILSFYKERSLLIFNNEAPITCSKSIMDNPKMIDTTHLDLGKNIEKSETHLLVKMQYQFKNDMLDSSAKNPILNFSEISYKTDLISLFKSLQMDSTVRLVFNGPFGCINNYVNRVQSKKSMMKPNNKYDLIVQKNNNLPSFIYLIVEFREQIHWLRLNTCKFLQQLLFFISKCFVFFSSYSYSLMPKTMPLDYFVQKVFKKNIYQNYHAASYISFGIQNLSKFKISVIGNTGGLNYLSIINDNWISEADINPFGNNTHLNDMIQDIPKNKSKKIHQQYKILESKDKSRMVSVLSKRKKCKLNTQPVLFIPIQTKHILSNLKNETSSQASDDRKIVKKSERQAIKNLNSTNFKKEESLKEDKIVNSSLISASSKIENPFSIYHHTPKCTELNENVCSNYPDSPETYVSSNFNEKYNFVERDSYKEECQLKLNSTDQYDEQLVPGQIQLSPDNLFENENLYSSSVDQSSAKTTQFNLEKYKFESVHPNFDLKSVETNSSMIYDAENSPNLEDFGSMDIEETPKKLNDTTFNEIFMDDTVHKPEKRFSFSRKRNFQSLTQDFKISSTQAFVPFYEPFKKQRINFNKNDASQNYNETESNLNENLKSEFSQNSDQLVPNENLSKKEINNLQMTHLNEADETVANFNTLDKANDVYGGLQICKKSIRLGLSKKINLKKRLHIL